jgi:endonuclease YncB( thermonuclease family)
LTGAVLGHTELNSNIFAKTASAPSQVIIEQQARGSADIKFWFFHIDSMKKYLIIGLVVLIIAIIYFYITSGNFYGVRTFSHKFCNSVEDCEMTCGGCVSKDANVIVKCSMSRSIYISNYTLGCRCENFQCADIKIPLEKPPAEYCSGEARCFFGSVTNVVDGDTLVINNETIRLALVDAPEYGEEGYEEAKNTVSEQCPADISVVVDVDDGQIKDAFGRTLAAVHCRTSGSINSFLAFRGFVKVDKRFCEVSEFADEYWTGC